MITGSDLNGFFDMRVAVAVSGGSDSMALLHMMRGRNITALTVDHGLRTESAAEAAGVAAFCKKIGVPHHILKWDGTKYKTGIEEAARIGRYDLMTKYCLENDINVLAIAHQRDDNIETFFMNLARGSGLYGLSGMKEVSQRGKITMWRPLLNVSRADLEKYCAENKVPYISDPMNDDESFTRVKIRKNRALLGLSDDRVQLAIQNLSRAREAIESEADKIFANIPVEIDADLLLNGPDEIRYRRLAKIIGGIPACAGMTKHGPRLDKVKNAFAKLDSGDCKFTLGGNHFRRINGKIRIWTEGTKWQK